MPKNEIIWNRIISHLRTALSEEEYDTWLAHTRLRKMSPESALIEVPNKFFAQWLEDHYRSLIQDAFEQCCDLHPRIRFTFPEEGHSLSEADPEPSRAPVSVTPLFQLSDFHVASCNAFAFHSAVQIAENRSCEMNPLMIFGAGGSGKTHLLQGMANRIREKDPTCRILYIESGHFAGQIEKMDGDKTCMEFHRDHIQADYLLMDDIDCLGADTAVQKTLLCIFDSLHQARKPMVFTARHAPSRMPSILPELRSRLEWGVLSRIDAPTRELRMEILQKEASDRNMELPEDVRFFLAAGPSSVPMLLERIDKLQRYVSSYARPIDISAAKVVCRDRDTHRITPDDIVETSALHFRLPSAALRSSDKSRSLAYPRHIAMYLARVWTELSYKEIAAAFGKTNHSTVIHAVKQIEAKKSADPSVKADLHSIQELLL